MNVTAAFASLSRFGVTDCTHFTLYSCQHGVCMILPLMQLMVPKPETVLAFSIALEIFGLSNVISARLSQIWHDRKNQFAQRSAA